MSNQKLPAKVRYIGSNARLSGKVGVMVERPRHLSLNSGDLALVFFAEMPRPVAEWNLRTSDLEAA